MEIKTIIDIQKKFFKTGETRHFSFRKETLVKLKEGIIEFQGKIEEALYNDLGKSSSESYMTEIGMVLEDITFQIKHLKRWMKKKKVKTPMAQFKARSYQIAVPYGNTLIISPWNYPFLLSIQPLVGAIAAGNTVLLKPSEYSVYTSEVINTLIQKVFKPEHVSCVLGDYRISSEVLNYKFDYIFFTGGTKIGKLIYEAASSNLTPVTLELGGKSPTIVDETAKIDLAAKRIVFGKFLNCGQTCVAPDYVVVQNSCKDKLIASLKKWLSILYADPLSNEKYGRIINEQHFNRLLSYLENQSIVYGGSYDRGKLKIEPTILVDVNLSSTIMEDEIFGPILPIISYSTKEELFFILGMNPQPLALYLFTTDKKFEDEVISKISFGGGCVNDTIIHLATTNLPFGGVGNSGIGAYHGRASFRVFSHYKSIVKKANWPDLPIRYSPYSRRKDKIIRFFMH